MRKILFMLFITFMLLGSVAAAEWDNVKSYDEYSKTITIKNAFGLPLIGDKIADVQLKTPGNLLVAPGYQKVAEFEIKGYTDYPDFISQLEFYDLNQKTKKITRAFDLKYKTYENVLIDDYSESCSASPVSQNGTTEEVCQSVLSGSHYEMIEAWIKLTPANLKQNENITIGIFTDVQIKDKVEWIPTFAGERVTEWATWTADLNVGLRFYYNFDNTAGTKVNDSLGVYNGTAVNMENGDWIAGKLGNALRFGGTNEYVNTTYNEAMVNASNFSINFWFNASTWPNTQQFGYLGDRLNIRGDASDRMVSIIGDGVDTTTATGTTDVANNSWHMITFVRNRATDKYSIWVDGINQVNATDTLTGTMSVLAFYLGDRDGTGATATTNDIDELGWWNRTLTGTEINTQLWNGGTGITFTPIVTDASPSVNLTSPANGFNSSSSTITFSGIASDDLNLTNVSLYLNATLNQTNSSGLNNSEYNFSLTLADGLYNWTYQATDNASQSTTAATRIFTIDTISPSVNLTFPDSITYNDGYITNATKTAFINFTASDTNLKSCWYSTDGGATNISLTCGTNATIGLAYSSYDIRAYANDTAGNLGSDSATPNFEYRIVQHNLTYNNNTIEGVLENFNLNFSVFNTTFQASTLNLSYNNTNYSGSFTQSGLNYGGTASLVIPDVTSTTNVSFYFGILLADSSIYTSRSNNQTIQNLGMDNCASFTTLIFNYTLLDEKNQVNITSLANTTIELSLSLFDELKTNNLLNFSRFYNNTNPAKVCLNVNLTSTTKYAVDSIVKYQGDNYEPEYYNLINFSLSSSSIPQNINLFDLLTSESTEFKITFKDDNFQAVPNALINIQRQYITENNTFKVVELPKTDSNGQTLGHFVEKDIIYNILVTNGTGGEILGIFNNIIPFCADPTIGDCEINLNSFSSGESVFDYDETLQVGLTAPAYDSVTRILSMDFVTFDGSTKNITMQTFKYDQLGNTTACSNSLTSSSGTLSCTIPSALGNSSIQIYVYVNGNLAIQDFKVIDSTGFGYEGYFIALMLILLLIVIFSDDKTAMIVASIMGMIAGVILSLIKGSFIGLGASGLFFIVSAIILIWKLNKSNP